ncbi:MAG TPA: hypothetical protein VFS44_08875 [Gemmatimonadaceae bacterium]|nr:hypothetical protein [Gemmatimonadaceae bacterium]
MARAYVISEVEIGDETLAARYAPALHLRATALDRRLTFVEELVDV